MLRYAALWQYHQRKKTVAEGGNIAVSALSSSWKHPASDLRLQAFDSYFHIELQ
jgi:hypothetical protein